MTIFNLEKNKESWNRWTTPTEPRSTLWSQSGITRGNRRQRAPQPSQALTLMKTNCLFTYNRSCFTGKQMRNSWLCAAKYLNSWLNKNLNYSNTNKSFNPLIHLILFSPNKIPFCSYQSSSCGFWRWSRLHLSTTCLSPWRLFSYSNVTVDVKCPFLLLYPSREGKPLWPPRSSFLLFCYSVFIFTHLSFSFWVQNLLCFKLWCFWLITTQIHWSILLFLKKTWKKNSWIAIKCPACAWC